MSRSTHVTFEVSGTPIQDRIIGLEVRQFPGEHVVAVVDLMRTVTTAGRLHPERSPVHVRWGRFPDVSDFYGYIHHHQAVSAPAGDVRSSGVSRYVLIGTSLPMNAQRTRSWPGVTGSFIAKTVAAEHGLRSIIHQSPGAQPFVAQDGMSDMALLASLAKDDGYQLWINGPSLWYVDPNILLFGPRSMDVPTFTQNSKAGTTDSLLTLEVLTGTGISDGGVLANYTSYGFDPRSKRFFQTTGSGGPDAYIQKVDQSSSSDSISEALKSINSHLAKSRRWIRANARVQGLSRLRPGSVVLVAGGAVSAEHRGAWLVESIIHNLDMNVVDAGALVDGYTCTLELGRSGTANLGVDRVHDLNPAHESTKCLLNDKNNWIAVDGGTNYAI